jgi:hypothetical protein
MVEEGIEGEQFVINRVIICTDVHGYVPGEGAGRCVVEDATMVEFAGYSDTWSA